MEDVKHWLTSRTIWVSFLGIVVQLLHVLKIDSPLNTLDLGVAADQIVNVITGVLFLAAAFFRAKATTQLTK